MPSKLRYVAASMIFAVFFGIGCMKPVPENTNENQSPRIPAKQNPTLNLMRLTSPAFKHNGDLPVQYSCDGAGLNPPLEFGDAPSGTRSFVLIEEDPDAPSGVFIHWIVFNIPPQTTSFTDAPGFSGRNSAGRTGYVPACPPDGKHRYIFQIFALDKVLDLKAGATKEEIEEAMSGHVLDQAEIMATYQR